ncbi:MAG: signal peptidase I [Planctomycetes bacterium]|nr:signal peptidase I [Planctomycetota bacterium]MCA8934903.1 signal peptidase I [Planctomycetota bacterium]
MTEAKLKAVPAKGYSKLKPELRGRIADLVSLAALAATGIALASGSKLDGVWLRLPVLCVLLLLIPGAWFVHRKLGNKASPVLSGGVAVALAGIGLLSAALLKASGWAGLAGFLAILGAWSLRGSVDRAVVRGRDLKAGERGPITVIFEQVESLAAALVLVLLVWHFGLEAFRIPSGSMAPTLLGDPVTGDRVLVDKFAYFYRDPARWEPVVFRYPLRRTDPYVKRCIAEPGEQVLIAGGDVYIRDAGSGKIELLRKTHAAREVLWMPMVGEVDSNTQWVKHFMREGDVDYEDGVISLRKRAAAIFPRGETDDVPGNITDNDASFGATETPKDRYNQHIVGDVRLRAEITLESDGECLITIVRDEDSYTLELRPDTGGCKLFHGNGDDVYEQVSVEDTSAIEFGSDTSREVWFSLADGMLELSIDGEVRVELDVGTPLLDQLRARDKEKSIDLAGPEALQIASAEPGGGRQARVELRSGEENGAQVHVLGIDRDVYYVGRTLEDETGSRELPFQASLGEDQYFVLGDNSPGSADCRFWTRVTLFMKDGTQVTGSLDEPSQPEFVRLLARAGEEGDTFSAYHLLFRVAHFSPEERGDTPGDDGSIIKRVLEQLANAATAQGRAAVNFNTVGGGHVRVTLADIEHIQVQPESFVERKLFIGRPFAVFLSPRGMKLID